MSPKPPSTSSEECSESSIEMQTRHIIGIAGLVIALLGTIFDLIAVTAFAHFVLATGILLAMVGFRAELAPLLATWTKALLRCLWSIGRFLARLFQFLFIRASGGRKRGSLHRWNDLGDFDCEVVGESNYQPALTAVTGGRIAGSEGIFCEAELVPESKNKFDSMAVAVIVNGRKVGYLARSDAREFRDRLADAGLSGQATVCQAMIRGGGRRSDGEAMSYGIWLDIEPF